MLRIILAAVAALFVTHVHAGDVDIQLPRATIALPIFASRTCETIAIPANAERLQALNSRIQQAAKTAEGPNFDRHYVLTWFGSGAGGASTGVLIDLNSCVAVETPSLDLHSEFSVESNQLMTGLPDPEDPTYIPEWLVTRAYTWDGTEFIFECEWDPSEINTDI